MDIDRKNLSKILFAIIAFTALLYIHIYEYDFNIDDHAYFLETDYIKSGTFENLWQAFVPKAVSDAVYTPVTSIVQKLCYSIFHRNPAPYHLFSLFLYLLTLFPLYNLIYKATKNRSGASIGTAFFAIAPVHTEVVCWYCASGYLLVGLFSLYALDLLTDWLENGNRTLPFCVMLLLILAYLSQPIAFLFPILFLLYIWFFYRDKLKTSIPFLSIALIIATGIGLFAKHATSASRFADGVTLSIPYKIAINGTNLINLFIPIKLTPFYPYIQNYSVANWEILISAAALLLFFLSFIIKNKYLRFFILWQIVANLPYSHIFIQLSRVNGDRYTYIPSIGAAILVAAIWIQVSQLMRGKKKLLAILGVLLAFTYIFTTYNYSEVWRDQFTTFNYAYEISPEDHYINYCLGMEYAQRGELKIAKKMFEKCISIYPKFQDVYKSIGMVMQDLGEFAGSEKYLWQAYRYNPYDPEIVRLLIIAKIETDQFNDANYYIDSIYRSKLDIGVKQQLLVSSLVALLKKDNEAKFHSIATRYAKKISHEEYKKLKKAQNIESELNRLLNRTK